MEIVERALQRKSVAEEILIELELLEKWSEIGDTYLVGAAAYNLIVSPDIDIETFCANPHPHKPMEFLTALSNNPNVMEIKYRNYLGTSFDGLYFRLLYKTQDEIIWNIDMWLFSSERKGALSRDLVQEINQALTAENRYLILMIKEELIEREIAYPSIFIYEAVIDSHIQSMEEFLSWIEKQDVNKLTAWKPRN